MEDAPVQTHVVPKLQVEAGQRVAGRKKGKNTEETLSPLYGEAERSRQAQVDEKEYTPHCPGE